MRTQLQKYREEIQRLDRCIKEDVPACIKAHALVTLFIPRLVAILECTEEFAEEIGRQLAGGLCVMNSTCANCKKVQAMRGDNYCEACKKNFDLFVEHIMTGEPDFEDDETENPTG